MQKNLAKRMLETIILLPRNVPMLKIICIKVALDRVNHLIELIRGKCPHHLHVENKDDVLIAIEKFNEVL